MAECQWLIADNQVEKAGGVVSRWETENAAPRGRYIACGDPSLLDAALSLLRGQ